MPKINFTKIKGMDPVEPGDYPAVLAEFTYKAKAQSSGEPFYALTFVGASENETVKGRKFFMNLSLQEQSLWKFKKVAAALGTDQDVLEADDEFDTDEILQDLIGSSCTLRIGVSEYQGQMRNNVQDVLEANLEASVF